MRTQDYTPIEAKIIGKEALSPNSVSLTLGLKNYSFHSGQFVLVSVLGFGEVPISISSSPNEKEFLEVSIRSTGMVTKKICSLEVGDTIGVRGPFGNGFPITKLKNRDVILIGGGTGLMPLHSLIKYLEKNRKIVSSLTILSGARSPEHLLYKEEYQNWQKFARLENIVDTGDKNWTGSVGLITKLYDRIKVKPGSVIITCGPQVMYKTITARFAGKTVADEDLYFMLERKMSCGIGKCQHCTCGKLYTCLDGPVFSYSQIKYNKEAL